MTLKNTLQQENFITDNIIYDRMLNIDYRPLSRSREIDFIKKLKLSYYDDVSDDLKALYINYYGEVFPKFKEAYDRALGDEKEEILNRAIENAYEYRDRFMENNLRLVFSIACKYQTNDRLEDLYQVGILGMMRALEKFDIEQKTKFSTYASWWIKQAIKRYIADKTNTIRVPVHMFESIVALNKAERRLEQKFGRKPDKEELALELKISLQKIDSILKARFVMTTTSLDMPLREDDDAVLGDIIPSVDASPEEIVLDIMTREMIEKVISNLHLDDRSKRILYLRYGFEDGKTHTLEEIGNIYGITRERVRQLEQKVLSTLRTKNNIHYLAGNEDGFLKEKKENDKVKIEEPYLEEMMDNKSFEEIRNLLLETDLNDLDEELQTILNIRYGLSLVIASAEEIAEWKGVTEKEIEQKEKEALKYVYTKKR